MVVADLDTEKIEALDHFYFIPIDVDRGMFSLRFLKSMIISFILLTLRERLLLSHQFLYLIPVLCLIIV